MWILENILEESDIELLTDEQLKMLASCAQDGVKYRVKQYLYESDEKKNTETWMRVHSAFQRDVFDKDQFLSDTALEFRVRELKNLQYKDINIQTPIEDLKRWNATLDEVFSSDYSVAYIAPTSKSIIETLISDLEWDAKETDDSAKAELAKTLKANAALFKAKVNAKNRRTSVSDIMMNYGKYMLLHRGIKFLIKKKENGDQPLSWEIL